MRRRQAMKICRAGCRSSNRYGGNTQDRYDKWWAKARRKFRRYIREDREERRRLMREHVEDDKSRLETALTSLLPKGVSMRFDREYAGEWRATLSLADMERGF